MFIKIICTFVNNIHAMVEKVARYIITFLFLVTALPGIQAHGYQYGYDDSERDDRLYDLSKVHHGCGDACISDVTTPYRLFSSRPHRVSPTYGHSGGKVTGRCFSKHSYQPLISVYPHVAFRRITSGYCAASRLDYIYVLRHIII